MKDTDTPFRVVGCRNPDCRTLFLRLYWRDDRLTYDMLAPVLTPGTGHTAPISSIEVIPADDDMPEWKSKYAGMTREIPDPRGAWTGGWDVEEETAIDPTIEVTCGCKGPHTVDLQQIVIAAKQWRKDWLPWPVREL